MGKYKYEVYEVASKYVTETSGSSKEMKMPPPYQGKITVYKFNENYGTFSEIEVSMTSTYGYYYKIDYSYYQFKSSIRYYGGSRQYYAAELVEVTVKSKLVVGNLIESIVADENAYPTNGTKDGKWYIRREKVAEIKAKFNNETLTKAYYKDSQNVIKKLSKAYFKDINGNIKRLI